MGIGIGELLIVLAIVVLIFGASRIPKLAGGLGTGIRNFKQGLKDPEEGEGKPKGAIED